MRPFNRSIPYRLLLPLALFALPPTANADESAKVAEAAAAPPEQHLQVSIGYAKTSDTSTPGQEITQEDTPLSFSLETARYVFEVSIPYIQRSAPSGKVAKSHHHESKKESTSSPIVATSGLGDVTASLQLPVLDEKDSLVTVTLKGEMKLATADLASGLGTGVNDYAGEMAVSKTVGDFAGSASIGYAILGSPGEVKVNDVTKFIYFNNIVFGSLSGSYQLSERFNAGMELAMGQATEAGGSQQRDLTLSMQYRFSEKYAVDFHAVRSLTPGIVSRGFGASFSSAM